MKKYIFIASLAWVSLTTMAQEPLSLSDFRGRVMDYSQSLKMSHQNVLASESKFKMVRTGFYPSLAATAGGNYFIGNPGGKTFDLKDYAYNANLTIQQNVYTGNAVSNQTKAARIELDIAQMTMDQTVEQVLYGADVTYWALAASTQQLAVTDKYVKIVENLYRIVSDRFDDGYISRTDLLMVGTRLNEAKMQQITSRKFYQNSLQNLNSMLGQYEPHQYEVSDTISVPGSLPSFVTLEQALSLRPEYLIAQRQVDLQNQNIRLARAKYNPQLVVGVQGVFGTKSINIDGEPVGYGVVFANFKAPIFHWNERRHDVARAKSGVRAAEYSLVDTRDAVGRDLSTARISIEQSFDQAQVAKSNLLIAQENLELNTYSYSEGRLPILDVLSAQLAWIQSYTAAVNANYQ
ncbi:MAG: TolC family protein, partial [Mucinivorans sp.]